MAILDIFSQRKKTMEQSGKPDVYQYIRIPESVINQIIMILGDAFGRYEKPWDFIIRALAREYGDPSILLCQKYDPSSLDARISCLEFLRNQMDIDRQLDLIELSFKLIESNYQNPGEAIHELNYRLKEGGVGYQYENHFIIRMDSQFIHAEVTKKALSLLGCAQFSGAEDEFLSAHKHYRHGEHKDAIVDAGASFESAMKSICDAFGWQYEKGARASDLIKVLREHRLFPDYLDKSFDQLLAILKSGLPEIRNNEGSHGQGSIPKRVPAHIAAYAIHLAATNIVFLVECMNDLQTQMSR